MPSRTVDIGSVQIGGGAPLAVLAGPCVIESREHTLRLAEAIERVASEVGVPLIFKASFDKANRSSVDSFRGPGLDEGLAILDEVRARTGLSVVSDIHEPRQAEAAGQVLDLLQIPAFLCRQTDLLVAAARTGKAVNVKKGQFMSPEEMANVVEKLAHSGAAGTLLTERGTFFGYNRLVNDMTAIPRMQQFAPVVFDATHSCQHPGGQGTQSGGQRAFAGTLASAAVAAGADALFVEVHDQPDQALSDAATVLPIDQFRAVIQRCVAVREALVSTPANSAS